MSRRLKQDYVCRPLGELARQLAFSPPDKRAIQVRRIETLHDQLDPASNYPIDFLAYRITGYRREAAEAIVLAGEAVLADLRLMIDQLSRSVRIPMEMDSDPVETVPTLAERLAVSTKTVGRWRKAGLRWRWATPEDGGRKVLVIPRLASDRFVREHPERVSRAAAFTQIDPQTRRQLLQRARQITRRRDVSLNQVASHLASKTGRGLETIRQVLSNHDRAHPDRAIFADHVPPLRHRQKRVIARAYRMGVPVDRIAARFQRTRSTIYRVLHQHGAGKAGRVSLTYIESPTFSRDDAEQVFLSKPIESLMQPTGRSSIPTDDLPEPIAALFDRPVLAQENVRTLFVRYNYVKYRAAKAREGFDRYSPGAKQVRAFNHWVNQARQLRDLLVRLHLPVVLSVARRHIINEPTRSTGRLMELIEAGLVVLIQSAETFNPTRQDRFESILTNRLLARYVTMPKPTKRQAHRRERGDEALERLIGIAEEAGVMLEKQES